MISAAACRWGFGYDSSSTRPAAQAVVSPGGLHFRFNEADNRMMAALGLDASSGYDDPRKSVYANGYQRPPVNWGMDTERKRQFFALLKEVTGA